MQRLVILVLFAGCQNADRAAVALAQNAAASAAATLDANAATAGVKAQDFTVEATLDEQLISLDDLITNKAQAKLRPTGRRVYVMSAGDYRSAVLMRKADNVWRASAIHGSDLASPIAGALSAVRSAHKPDGGDLFLVDVAGMHLKLIGHREKGALMLTPIDDRPDLALAANATEPATQLLAEIADDAALWAAESAKFFTTPAR
jgi:hypothetical protein